MLMDLNKISIDMLIKFCDCQEFDLVIEHRCITGVVKQSPIVRYYTKVIERGCITGVVKREEKR